MAAASTMGSGNDIVNGNTQFPQFNQSCYVCGGPSLSLNKLYQHLMTDHNTMELALALIKQKGHFPEVDAVAVLSSNLDLR